MQCNSQPKLTKVLPLMIHFSESFPLIKWDDLPTRKVSTSDPGTTGVDNPVTTAGFESSFSYSPEDCYMILFSYYYHPELQDEIDIALYFNFELHGFFETNDYSFKSRHLSMAKFLICDEALKLLVKSQSKVENGAEQDWFCYKKSVDGCRELIYPSTTESVGKRSFRAQLIAIYPHFRFWASVVLLIWLVLYYVLNYN